MSGAKAIIAAGGLGTRMLPATKAVPKPLLPVFDRPLIQHTVEEAISAGFDKILILLTRRSLSIVDHFSKIPELENELEREQNTEMLEEIQKFTACAAIQYVYLPDFELGHGTALLMARDFVGDDTFALLLSDELFDPSERPLPSMMELSRRHEVSVIAVKPREGEPEIGRATKILPATRSSSRRPWMLGRYVLTREIFPMLESLSERGGMGVSIFDGLNQLAESGRLLYKHYRHQTWDAGDRQGYLEANVAMAVRDPTIGPSFLDFLRRLVRDETGKLEA